MLTKEQELRTEFGRLQTEADGVIKLAETENRDLTTEERTAQDQRFARMTTIKNLVDEAGKFASLKLSEGKVTKPASAPGREEYARTEGADGVIVVNDNNREEFGRAVNHWLDTGQMDRKFATITTATQSSLLLPKKVVTPVVNGALNSFREGYAAYGMQALQTIGDTSQFNVPFLDPTAGGQVAENASSETENAPTMAESILSVPKTYQSGSVYFSNLSLRAVGFDLLAAILPNQQFNKELGLESTIVAAMIADNAITQVVAAATTGTLTFANMVSLNNKLPKRYQQLKINLLSADAFAAVEGLVDDNGRPIMVMDAQNNNLRRVLGTPTIRCDYLEAFGTSKVLGLQISLMGFHLRDCGDGLQRYDQVPAKPNQVGTNLFSYHAYGYAVSAVAKLKTPAS